MRAAGASDAEIQRYRVETDGPEAADRLAELDRRRAAWAARLQTFRAARAALLSAETEPAEPGLAVRRLLEGSFTPLEQIRVEATDHMDAAP